MATKSWILKFKRITMKALKYIFSLLLLVFFVSCTNDDNNLDYLEKEVQQNKELKQISVLELAKVGMTVMLLMLLLVNGCTLLLQSQIQKTPFI